MRAMILAAGRGERLRPLTDSTPKPLLTVAGRPLIVHHLKALAEAGVTRVVINLAWLGEQILRSLGADAGLGLDIHYSPEPPGALETAGGILQALDVLGPEPFLVISGDIHCDFPIKRLYGFEPDGQAHLVLVDNPAHHPGGDFGLDDNGRLDPDGEQRLTYSGIAVMTPELFSGLAPGRRALRPVLDRALAAGQLTGEHYRGYWSDIGTPERLEAARRANAAGPATPPDCGD